MAEEQKWQEPGGHKLCANNCGFFGSPTTLHLCSKCYKDHCIKEEQMSKAKLAVEQTLIQSDSEPPGPSTVSVSADLLIPSKDIPVSASAGSALAEVVPPATVSQPNRCATCQRRVGLTGFTCKCGTMFCGSHRYPEQHGCSFDFKALGKEAIAKANPVIKGEKLDKI